MLPDEVPYVEAQPDAPKAAIANPKMKLNALIASQI